MVKSTISYTFQELIREISKAYEFTYGNSTAMTAVQCDIIHTTPSYYAVVRRGYCILKLLMME